MARVLRNSGESMAPVYVDGIGGGKQRGWALATGYFRLGGNGHCSLSLGLAAGHIQRGGDSACCSSLILGASCSRTRMWDPIRFTQPSSNRCLDSRGCGLDERAVGGEPRQDLPACDTELFSQLMYPCLASHCLGPHLIHRMSPPILRRTRHTRSYFGPPTTCPAPVTATSVCSSSEETT